MPYHGRSNPPDGWWLRKYKLTTADYLAQIRAVWKALDLVAAGRDGLLDGRRHRPEAGRRLSARTARRRRPRKLGLCARAVQRLPASSGDSRRRACGELHVRPLRAVESRSRTRARTGGTTASPGPGVYAGDVHFYSVDWDGRADLARIDTSVCKVSLLTGEFDYSCTPDMTRAAAKRDSRDRGWSS